MATATPPPREAENFVEAALALGGKSADEVRTTGTIDRADDQVEAMFDERYRTSNSPIHRAVWGRSVPMASFRAEPAASSGPWRAVMDRSLEVVRRRKGAGALLDGEGKVSAESLGELAGAGYWGLRVSPEYGGAGAPFSAFAKFLTEMATVDPTVAGLASVHGCIGAVGPVSAFGTAEQKRRMLPGLASGERLSAFALTEPGAGSDLTALKTTAERDGDDFVVNGEKLFITNAVPGRTVGLVCKIEGKPAVLVVDLPDHEDEHFRLVRYGLHALKHTHNNGLLFQDFRAPAANLLRPARGDGLTIAYHGLNLGRIALCATAAGAMRGMLAGMLPWARFRQTYGAPIADRELVRRRVGRLAALIVGCDALVDWCSSLLDQGYRGEMECVIAKIFGSEAQKEAAIELSMKTHGGRAFLHGHPFGDEVHEYLAPCIYEGEGEMLGMSFFKSLIKDHGKEYFEPIGRALSALGVRKPDPFNPKHAWALKGPLANYAGWWSSERAALALGGRPDVSGLPGPLAAHARRAALGLQRARFEISGTMRKHQLALADRQCRMAELSRRTQDLVVMLVVAQYAPGRGELVEQAADVLCRDLWRGLTGERPTDRDLRASTSLGEAVASGGFAAIAGVDPGEILMTY